jgi:Na+/melibiose symporter-like transporter
VAALGLPLVVYLPPYYAGTLGLPLATVGFLFAVVRLVDIPLDPLLGALMDNGRSRWGQFRPWLAAGGVILAAGVWLLFMAQPGVTAVQAFLSLFILYLGFSLVYLAQTAWGSRLSADYAERARIFGWWQATNVAAILLVLLIPPLAAIVRPGGGPALGVHAMGWFILLLIPLAVGLCVWRVPEGEAPVPGAHRVRLADVRRVLVDGRMRRLLLADLLASVVPGITGALFLFYFVSVRGVPVDTASKLLLGYFLAGLIAAPLWVRAARHFGKHRAVAIAIAWLGLAQLGVWLAPPDSLLLGAGSFILAGVPYAAPPFLLRAMLADLNDAQALDRQQPGRDGADSTGLNYAILTATQKLGYAIPVGLTYPALGWIGFDPTPEGQHAPGALAGLEMLFVGPPLLLGLLGARVVWNWPITAERHAAIRAQLDT